MNSTSVVYNDIRYESLFGYYHGSACGDIDNEGDIDIILPDASNRITHTLVNDGAVNFAIIDNLIEDSSAIFTCDLHDINYDGFLDLIWGGGADGKWDGQEWRTEVIWEKGKGFLRTNPISILPNWDLVTFLDYDFYDFNQDWIDEIVTAITTSNYDGWEPKVYKWDENGFVDASSDYFSPGENVGVGEAWIGTVDLERVDNELFLVTQ